MRSSLRALNPRCQESLGNSREICGFWKGVEEDPGEPGHFVRSQRQNEKCEHLGIDRYGNMEKYWKQVSQIKSDSLRTCSLHVELELERMPWTSFPTLSLSCSIFSLENEKQTFFFHAVYAGFASCKAATLQSAVVTDCRLEKFSANVSETVSSRADFQR